MKGKGEKKVKERRRVIAEEREVWGRGKVGRGKEGQWIGREGDK